MKKTLFTLLFATFLSTAFAQKSQLTGEWKLTASPFEGGTEVITFTATLSSDKTYLECHTDQFFTRNSKAYPMDWKISIETEGDNIRLGWVLDAEKPASTQEYQDTQYAIGGAPVDENHRYIYLLSENTETQKLEGMTLWSNWQSSADAVFELPKTQQIYAAVSPNIPYSGGVGYIDIWASGKLQKNSSDPSGISDITRKASISDVYYDLQGRRLQSKPEKGIYIQNGKKYIIK